jgi:hypothetical protein
MIKDCMKKVVAVNLHQVVQVLYSISTPSAPGFDTLYIHNIRYTIEEKSERFYC